MGIVAGTPHSRGDPSDDGPTRLSGDRLPLSCGVSGADAHLHAEAEVGDAQAVERDVEGRAVAREGRNAQVRWSADRAMDMIRDRFGCKAVGYGSVALGLSRSVPDAFRELAEKDL